jgi:hypothetical protein
VLCHTGILVKYQLTELVILVTTGIPAGRDS